MNNKKVPYNTQVQFAIMAGKSDEAHDVIGRALAEIGNGALEFAQSYPFDDLPFVIVAMKVAVNALESMLGPNGKALADTIYSRTDSIVVDASEFKRQAKGGDGMADIASEAPTVELGNQWVRTADRMPDIPGDEKSWAHVSVIAAKKGSKKSGPMIYERAVIRGKTVYRWKYVWDRIYDGDDIFAWMPYPESPEEEVENG